MVIGQIKHFLNKYLLLIILFSSFLTLLPYISFFWYLQIEYISGVVYRGIVGGFISVVLILLIIFKKERLPVTVYILTTTYVLSQFVTILISPYINNTTVKNIYLIGAFAQTIINALSTIAYLNIFNKDSLNKKTIDVSCLIIIIIGLLLCLYSYIFEYNDIYNTFNTIYGWNYDVTSIFIDKTTYGFVLFICFIFAVFYIENNKRYWMYILPLFFLANMFISRSKTSILCTTIVITTLLIIHMNQSWKEKKKIWIITLGIGGIIIGLVTIFTINKVGIFNNFNYYISEVIYHDGIVVMNDRIHKWLKLVEAVNNPFNIIFGYGERITPMILNTCGCATIGDNIYLSNYGIGGLFKFISYVALVAYIIIITWKNEVSKLKRIMCLAIQLSFAVSGFFEDDSIVGITTSGLLSSIIFYSCNKMIKVDLSDD